MKNMYYDNLTNTQNNIGLTRVISFTSGKGGVGKSTSLINIGVSLVNEGRRVLVLDADLGLANIDILLGLTPKYTLEDLLFNEKSIEDIILESPCGLSVIPAGSGVLKLLNLSVMQKSLLMSEVERIAKNYDYLLIDTGAGINDDVLFFNAASMEVICVITKEPTSLTDTYSLIKVLLQKGEKEFSILVNNVSSELEAKNTYKKLFMAVEKFLRVRLKYIGYIPSDEKASEAILKQKAYVEMFPSSEISRKVVSLTKNLDSEFFDFRVKGGMQFFFEQLLELNDVRQNVVV
ncbi:MAG: MinD/ParA family protein [Bdellovibrionota bacterium]